MLINRFRAATDASEFVRLDHEQEPRSSSQSNGTTILRNLSPSHEERAFAAGSRCSRSVLPILRPTRPSDGFGGTNARPLVMTALTQYRRRSAASGSMKMYSTSPGMCGSTCFVHQTLRSPRASDLSRDPGNGGCAVSKPQSNLGFRLSLRPCLRGLRRAEAPKLDGGSAAFSRREGRVYIASKTRIVAWFSCPRIYF
jgi:hypothetical protein